MRACATAHDVAVREAVGHLERSAAAVRRGHGGAIVEEASGLVAAAFRHRTSRAGDPQLHTHVLVANLGRGVDGRWSALDGRRLYAEARAASFIYQAVLRGELTRTVGVEWTPVRRGIAEVVGVPRSVMRAFSRRRAEIDAALAERGTSGARAAEAAALATRRAKDPRVDAEHARRRVADARGGARVRAARSSRGSSAGGGRATSPSADWAAVARAARRAQRADAAVGDVRARRGAAGAVRGAAARGARGCPDAGGRAPIASSRRVPCRCFPMARARATGEAFRRRDGRLMPAGADRLRYSTPEHLALERRLVERAVARARRWCRERERDGGGRASSRRGRRSRSSSGASSSRCASTATAWRWSPAGPGPGRRSRSARRARRGRRPGCRCSASRSRGGRPASCGRAPGFAARAWRRCSAISRSGETLPERCVLVVDEAGMVPTRELARAARSRRAGVGQARAGRRRSAAAGDRGRRGVPRADSARAGGRARRERPAGERVGARGARSPSRRPLGGGARAVRRARRAGRRADGARRFASGWSASGSRRAASGDCVMIAQRRADVADLNALARERAAGARACSGDEELELAGGAFAVGDQVVVKRNDLRLGVTNGQRGEVVAVDRGAGLADGRVRRSAGRARSRVPVGRRRATASRRCSTATR